MLATFHDTAGVLVLTRNGSAAQLMQTGRDLRSLLALPDGRLLVAQASNADSQILALPNACSGSGAASFSRDGALVHPYGLAAHGGVVYVTNQNGNDIVRLNATTGAVLDRDNNGAFASLGSPRAIVASPETESVFACSNLENQVIEFAMRGGARRRSLAVTKPVGLLLLREAGLLLVGSADPASPAVLAVSLASWSVVRELRHALLQHPVGLALLPPATLLVLSQDNALVLAWNAADWEQEALVWASELPARPEALTVVEC